MTEEQLIDQINALNDDNEVDGILVQLPLPSSMDERKVCNAVSPEKDVDGFHIINIGQLCLDMQTIVPATALAVVEMLKRFNIETFGRNAVVVGRSKNVGMPIAMMLHSDRKHDSGLGMDATVTICHRYTPRDKLEQYCRNADIIITATGVPNLIRADMVKPGATVIDVGITRITDEEGKTKLVGDIDYPEIFLFCQWSVNHQFSSRGEQGGGAITPVPGGVGPMTVAMLMQHFPSCSKDSRENYLPTVKSRKR
ncbi:hypothetical protein EVAR_16377_1 [Eumeta japonica]|uniref:methenyltetrahydrofolate cyclohydrolase n=1 Tax=Eumeta variegata TaxID=151549 RepID=A0A4C1VU80_EUMVA|nr:hypothetical protein EVAR_16377_1 [Eumeta japonica]